MDIGNNVRKMRKRRGYTLNTLAERFAKAGGRHVSPCTIGAWERGEKSIDAQNIPFLALALECSISSLYDDGNQTEDEKIRSLIMQAEYDSLTENEREIIYNAFTKWNGNVHALIQMVGIYISLPPSARSDISIMSIIKFENSENRTQFDKLVDIDFINREWLCLTKKKDEV